MISSIYLWILKRIFLLALCVSLTFPSQEVRAGFRRITLVIKENESSIPVGNSRNFFSDFQSSFDHLPAETRTNHRTIIRRHSSRTQVKHVRWKTAGSGDFPANPERRIPISVSISDSNCFSPFSLSGMNLRVRFPFSLRFPAMVSMFSS